MARQPACLHTLPTALVATVFAAALVVPAAAQNKSDIEPDRGVVEAEGPAKKKAQIGTGKDAARPGPKKGRIVVTVIHQRAPRKAATGVNVTVSNEPVRQLLVSQILTKRTDQKGLASFEKLTEGVYRVGLAGERKLDKERVRAVRYVRVEPAKQSEVRLLFILRRMALDVPASNLVDEAKKAICDRGPHARRELTRLENEALERLAGLKAHFPSLEAGYIKNLIPAVRDNYLDSKRIKNPTERLAALDAIRDKTKAQFLELKRGVERGGINLKQHIKENPAFGKLFAAFLYQVASLNYLTSLTERLQSLEKRVRSIGEERAFLDAEMEKHKAECKKRHPKR